MNISSLLKSIKYLEKKYLLKLSFIDITDTTFICRLEFEKEIFI